MKNRVYWSKIEDTGADIVYGPDGFEWDATKKTSGSDLAMMLENAYRRGINEAKEAK